MANVLGLGASAGGGRFGAHASLEAAPRNTKNSSAASRYAHIDVHVLESTVLSKHQARAFGAYPITGGSSAQPTDTKGTTAATSTPANNRRQDLWARRPSDAAPSVRSAHKRPNRPSDHPACAMPPPTEAIPAVCHEPTPAAPQASTAENRLCSRCSSRHARSLGVGPPARGQRRAGPSDGRHNCLTGLANGHDALSGGNPAVSMPAHLRRLQDLGPKS